MSGHFLDDLRATFERYSARPALTYRGRTICYGELDTAARRAAALLQAAGVTADDRVILFSGDKLPFIFAHLGALYAGAVPLPLNPRFTREEMRFYLRDSMPRVIVAGSQQRSLVESLAAELSNLPNVIDDQSMLDPQAAPYREPSRPADDPCLILYSSGTTGWPKGVVHTHANVASSLEGLASCWRMTPDDVVVNLLPLFHIHGLSFATQLTWLTGGCLLVEDAFTPAAAIDAIKRGTVFMGVPPMYYSLIEEPQFREAAKSWQQVRLFTCGSAPIRTDVLPELETILNRPIINRYGMTESHVITSLPLDGPWPSGSVGLPLSGVDVRVVLEDGRSAAIGEVGSVQIRGPNLFHEYWNNPGATRSAMKDGWFDTGDLGSRDAAGFLTLVGRKHDLIITSGYNVYPQVVERVLSECPGVKECAVCGLPDTQRGERVAAAVVRSDAALDELRLREWLSERLVHYQQPKTIAFVESLPRNSLGKISRQQLQVLFED